MNRRELVTALGGATTVSLAGCLGGSDDTGSGLDDVDETDVSPDDNSPEGVVVRYYTLLNDGDEDGVRELFHEESPLLEDFGLDEDDIEAFEDVTLIVDHVAITNEGEESAIVEVSFVFGEEDTRESQEQVWLVRLQDDDWRLWAEIGEVQTNLFSFEYDEDEETVDITLDTDTLLVAGELFITSDDFDDGYWYEFPGIEEYDDESILQEGAQITVPAAPDYQLEVIREYAGVDVTTVIDESSGPEA